MFILLCGTTLFSIFLVKDALRDIKNDTTEVNNKLWVAIIVLMLIIFALAVVKGVLISLT